MDILIGMGAALCTEIGKRIAAKYGVEFERYVIYIGLLLVAVVYALFAQNLTVQHFLVAIEHTMSSAIFFYEIALKRLAPVLPPPPQQ